MHQSLFVGALLFAFAILSGPLPPEPWQFSLFLRSSARRCLYLITRSILVRHFWPFGDWTWAPAYSSLPARSTTNRDYPPSSGYRRWRNRSLVLHKGCGAHPFGSASAFDTPGPPKKGEESVSRTIKLIRSPRTCLISFDKAA
jgi:hypothetical protein